MATIEIAIFLLVFAAVALAYEIGRGAKRGHRRPAAKTHTASPGFAPVSVLLEYRNATGHLSRNPVTILGYAPRRNGRSWLVAVKNGKSRVYRQDRIVSIAMPDGQRIDTGAFLHRLGAA